MSTNALPLASCSMHETLKDLGTSVRLHAERRGNLNACPCYPVAKFFLDQLPELLHHWLSLPETQCPPSPCGDSALNTFNITTGTVEAPFALDVGSHSFGCPSPIQSDLIHQPIPNTVLDSDNEMDALYLSGPGHLEGSNLNPEHFLKFSESFHPELSMTPSTDHASSQMWSPHALSQSPDTSSNGSLSCDYALANGNPHDYLQFMEPLSCDIQPHAQNSNDIYLPGFYGETELHSPTSSWSEERRSDGASLIDDMDGTSSLCRWGGGTCSSFLNFDKSEVGKHLQQLHGVKSGGDKDKISCNWDGCGKEMKKESLSRHIVAVHLSNKTECSSCGKQFARLDSKLRHLKNSKREECRESELHDSRTKRRRVSWP